MKWIWRAWIAGVGLACFVWLASESRETTWALLLGAALAATLGIPTAARRVAAGPPGARRVAAAGVAGLTLGALVPVLAAGLMLVKVSLHGHLPPDFLPADLIVVLGRIPAWAIGGGLLGVAAASAAARRGAPPEP